ncbi:MAG TPA: hypothetical protein VKV20_11010 [Ktedonobacteraceae bacterium]|jgi:hypothetical protein|nr:hypothetical protein [Ktedonobacteraceae bacterium]
MDPTVTLVEYIGFVIAALIIIWAVIEVGRRMYGKTHFDLRSPHTWDRLRSTRPGVTQELLSDSDDEEDSELDLHTRAKQNGHYSESKKPH